MTSNRRAFLQFAGLAPAAAATAGFATPASQPGSAVHTGPLVRSRFSALVGEEFRFEDGVFGGVVAQLSSVVDLGPDKAGAEKAFRLLFAPAVPGSIPQQTCVVTHPALGRFALFVSPNDAQGAVVEAIFNS